MIGGEYMTKKIRFYFSFILIFFITMSFYFFIKKDKSYVFKVNNKTVSKAEYLLYFYEQKKSFESKGGTEIWNVTFDGSSAITIAKQNTFESIKLVKICVEEAAKRNITIKPTDLVEVDKLKDAFTKELSIENINKLGISDNLFNEIMKENLLYQKVYEDVTKNIIISQPEFESFFNKYIEENDKILKSINISYVHLKNYEILDSNKVFFDDKKQLELEEKAKSILQKLNKENNFEVIKNMNDENYPIEVLSNVKVDVENFDSELVDVAYEMDVGELSQIINSEYGYYILKVNSITTNDIDKIKEEVEKYYIVKQKQKVFDNDYETWSNNAKISINKKSWDNISFTDFKSIQ